MFDFQFFKPLILWFTVVAIFAGEVYGLFRLFLRVMLTDTAAPKIIFFVLLLPVSIFVLYLDVVLIYLVGGGH